MSFFQDACRSIKQAEVEREVVVAVQRYLASIRQSDREQLPWGLYARPIANVGDLALWAIELSSDRVREGDAPPGAIYGQATEVFKRAAAKLVEMRRMDAPAAPAK